MWRPVMRPSIETCAADGSCAAACPVAIDTGKLVKELRLREHGDRAERVALELARRQKLVRREIMIGSERKLRRFIREAEQRGRLRKNLEAFGGYLRPDTVARDDGDAMRFRHA